MGNLLKGEHISDMQDIYSSSSHHSINIHPHVFIFELNAVGAKVIIATTLVLGTLGTCDPVRRNHARVGGLIPLLVEFATEWNKGFSGILS